MSKRPTFGRHCTVDTTQHDARAQRDMAGVRAERPSHFLYHADMYRGCGLCWGGVECITCRGSEQLCSAWREMCSAKARECDYEIML